MKGTTIVTLDKDSFLESRYRYEVAGLFIYYLSLYAVNFNENVNSLELTMSWMTNDKMKATTLVKDNKVISCCFWSYDLFEEMKNSSICWGIITYPLFRGKGFATYLMQECSKLWKKVSIDTCYDMLDSMNPSLLLKTGFKYRMKVDNTVLYVKEYNKMFDKNQEVKPGIYQHFKGGLYEVLGEAAYHDFNKKYKKPDDSPIIKDMVIYKVVKTSRNTPKGTLFYREKDNFLGKVDKKKYPDASQEYKFEFIQG